MAMQKIGPFQLEKQIGAGGMGVVYLATYEKTGQKVAVKILSPGMSSDQHLLARFERELKILKKLKHENIVQSYGGGKSGDQHFYAMELMRGGSLEQLIRKKGQLPWEQVIDLSMQIAKALEHAHQHGVIHRDLKPENLFFGKNENLKLGDFGIARDTQATALTAAGKTVGTYAYMAPEQISGSHPVSGKADLYALGCVMYQMLTGEPPFMGETSAQMLFKHLEEDPPRVREKAIDCPIWLEMVILKLLAKDPDVRHYDALAVQVALKEVGQKVTEQTSVAQQTTVGGPTAVTVDEVHPELRKLLQSDKKKKKKRRKKEFVPFYEKTWFLLISLLLLTGGVTWAMWPMSEDELFARADTLMHTEDTSNWQTAHEKYLGLYLERFPDGKHVESVNKYIELIEMDKAERQMETAIRFNRDPKSEVEGIFLDALRFEQSRDRITALAKYRAMITLYEGSPKDRAYVNLAKKKIFQIQSSVTKGDQVLDLINEALRKAEDFSRNGEQRKADTIWDSIVVVYGSNKEFEAQVNYAKAKRDGKDAEPLNFDSTEDKEQ